MTNYYEILSIEYSATTHEIKKAFRERAKRLHPDLAGDARAEEMRKLLVAYQTLSNRDRRFEYDRAYQRFVGKFNVKRGFDYRSFLKERSQDPSSQAKLIFFELLHLEEEAAISVWQNQGGLKFPMEKYLDREDWMDCSFLLAEELAKRQRYHEAFVLLVNLVREERRRPYFKHFMEDLENFLKELTRIHLRSAVDSETYLECLEALLDLGFSPQYEARILRSIAETLINFGESAAAAKVFQEALKRDPGLPNTARLRRKLNKVV